MGTRLLMLACLTASGLRAEMQLFAVTGTAEQLVGTAYNVGNAPSSDVLDTRFRLRNTGPATATLSSVTVAGVGFSLLETPDLPQSVPVGGAVEFTVRFRPGGTGSFSASLRADLTQTILRGTAFAAATVYAEQTLLASGGAVDFGSVERLSRAVRRFVFENRTDEVLINPGISVAGSGFRILDPPVIEIPPHESVAVTVAFEPTAVTAYEGQLRVDVRRFALRGAGLEIPLPKPQTMLDFDGQPPRSARQANLSVKLASPSRVSGAGTVRMEFRPAASGATADPAILFANGTRTAAFSVAEGDDMARFGPALQMPFQTGTTTGVIVFTTQLGDHEEQVSVTIPEEPVGLDKVTVSRTSSGLEVRVTGFDNTRSASQVVFTFYDRSDAAVIPGAIRVDVTANFRAYFATPDQGGAFALTAVFPVTGTADQVAGVEVEIANSAGSTRSGRVRF